MKSMVKDCLIHIGSFVPMLIFLDCVMGIQLFRDIGFIETAGFITCMVIYAEGFKYAHRAKQGL